MPFLIRSSVVLDKDHTEFLISTILIPIFSQEVGVVKYKQSVSFWRHTVDLKANHQYLVKHPVRMASLLQRHNNKLVQRQS